MSSLVWTALIAATVCVLLPEVSYAAWDNVLCNAADFAKGNLGKGLATVGILILGIGALLGKVSWGLAITVGVGIAALFNAPGIVNKLVNQDMSSCD
ncbi:MAG: TrbC/VirB2 family protein [Rickettsiales bacterium]|nr:TrbC/VirB2 family protein [Rickettsiales bacterium]